MGTGAADVRGTCGDGAASGCYFFLGAAFWAAWAAAAAGEGEVTAGDGEAAFGAAGAWNWAAGGTAVEAGDGTGCV